jgi:3'-phosphoadenosine 5'-phosphosulfate sulfotransferase (PAPS reductase)/FAD synthetase
MQSDPRLSVLDRDAWSRLMILARQRSKTLEFKAAVGKAKRLIDRLAVETERPAIMWSGGKDSTAMAHLAVVGVGLKAPVFSEKDDLDYPGELDYVNSNGAAWGADLRVVVPEVSPKQWITSHSHEIGVCWDMHSRAAQMSKECFYSVIESASSAHDGIMLGLRAAESRARTVNRAAHGAMYRKRNGQVVCCPLADWSGLDVFAYLESNGVEPFMVYRCIAFSNIRDPWNVRKSWWIPGDNARHGGVSWLRHYYPGLYRELLSWFERAQSYT